jgi:hypothetical protein
MVGVGGWCCCREELKARIVKKRSELKRIPCLLKIQLLLRGSRFI